jgi:16S rRNA (guanine966-N2)-methyltransferase
MRVIAGEAKGRRLRAPRGLAVRPTSARVRTSAFDILVHRGAIAGASVLDLYAGTGALGIEALSRGAKELIAVEKDRPTAEILRENLATCGLLGRAGVLTATVAEALRKLGGSGRSFDLVFADPPYAESALAETIARLVNAGLVRSGGWILAEHSARDAIGEIPGLVLELERRQGDSSVTLFRVTEVGEGEAHGVK